MDVRARHRGPEPLRPGSDPGYLSGAGGGLAAGSRAGLRLGSGSRSRPGPTCKPTRGL
ncbi:hypothetical protein BVI434_750001 [Burkholderia vietnamiensis]|nr:hypothetical protein BVI434_750001 [Burkholderia vietnamiensis]